MRAAAAPQCAITSALGLFGAMDVVTFLLTAVVLCGLAAIATLLPARRAASVDPRVAFTSQ